MTTISNNASFQHSIVLHYTQQKQYYTTSLKQLLIVAPNGCREEHKQQYIWVKEKSHQSIYPNIQLTGNKNPIIIKDSTTNNYKRSKVHRTQMRWEEPWYRTTPVIRKQTLKEHNLLLSQIHNWRLCKSKHLYQK